MCEPHVLLGGTTVARDTVYASVGVGLTAIAINGNISGPRMLDGFVIAYRPLV
jgi:hypothetical protein